MDFKIKEVFNKYLKDFEQNGWENGNNWKYTSGYINYIQNNSYGFFSNIHKLYCGITEYEKSDKNDPIVQMGRGTFEVMFKLYGPEYMLNHLLQVFNSAIITYIMNENSFDSINTERSSEVNLLATVVLAVYPKVADYFK